MILTNKGKFSNLDKVETGDILIYHSINNTSFGINFLTKSVYTHVGIAVWSNLNYNIYFDNNTQAIYSGKDKKLLIFETDLGTEKYDYVRQKNVKNNVRLISVEDNLINVNKIYVRKVNLKRDNEFYKKFQKFIDEHQNIPYETDKITILLYMMGMGISNRKKNSLNSAICTELVSKYLSVFFNIKNRYLYPKNYAIEYKNIFKENDILEDQYKIYDAEYDNIVLVSAVIITILIICAICMRGYSFYKIQFNKT